MPQRLQLYHNRVSREGPTIEIGRFLQNTYSEDMALMGNSKGMVSASETLNGAREIAWSMFALQA